MLLTQRFLHLFPSRIRTEGHRYFSDGRVESFHACPIHFFAYVQGTQSYTVGLVYVEENHALATSCTCPHYEKSGLCKHIWAAMTAADKEGALTRADALESRISLIDSGEMGAIIVALEEEELYDDVFTPPQGKEGSPDEEAEDPAIGFSAQRTSPPFAGRRYSPLNHRLAGLREKLAQSVSEAPRNKKENSKELLYVINVSASLKKDILAVDVGYREQTKDGDLGAAKFPGIRTGEIDAFPDEVDRQILSLLMRAEGTESWRYYYNYSSRMEYDVSPIVAPLLLQMMSSRERLFISRSGDPKAFLPVRFDSGEGWTAFLQIEAEKGMKDEVGNADLELHVKLSNGKEEISLSDVERMLPGGLLLVRDRIVKLADNGTVALIRPLLSEAPLVFSPDQLEAVLEELATFVSLPPIRSSADVPFETVATEPKPGLRLRRQPQSWGHTFLGNLQFDYDGISVAPSDPRSTLLNSKERRIVLRNPEVEQSRVQELRESGFAVDPRNYHQWQISPKKFVRAAVELIGKGWLIEAEGRLYRANGQLDMHVSSGIDWFDLEGTATFDHGVASLPELLRAIAKGENMVILDDGSFGLLPDEWIRRYGKLAKSVKGDDSALRFGSSQTILLDMLLAEMPEVRLDEAFRNARERLRSFEGIAPLDPPDSFAGQLRPYQKIALGWFHFLREFGFGGCLADDMGLGKTVQALALLEERRLLRSAKKGRKKKGDDDRPKGPSLAVVPKSLIFNWMQEAGRFAPKLRVLDYTGTGRREFQDRLDEFDLIITTYGTLRRDVPKLRETEFDYLILDESQAIKNDKSATAKAVRLLNGRHRLAMSGTPIENRLEELWSLFDFLNPGMLGSASLFNTLTGSQESDEARAALSRSLRPFILRRTKENVAADLPEKVEQTIFCELDKTQRKLYNELRDHFRASVLKEIDEKGMARSKIKVLEALLRLRQAACHPGLIDKTKGKNECAKFDLLLPQLQEIVEEGHKALVFSQFTSFLGLLRPQLEAMGIGYVYLDGKTRDRQEKVEQFQNDPEASLFLISLKAGGVGLNLTAAEYVFLLDPWWNPAVEAQAIDRTHRIGQTNNVFAYRLIVKDTVEEKVLQLQEAKRKLADAIITGENALVRDLAREDLELLLS